MGVLAANDAKTSLLREVMDWMLVPLIIAWPISMVLSYFIAMGVAERVFDRGLEAKVRSLAENLVFNAATDNVLLTVDLQALLADDDAAAHEMRVDNVNGTFIGSDNLLRAKPEQPVMAGQRRISFSDQIIDGTRVRVAALSMIPAKGEAPVVVQLSELVARRESLASEMLLSLLPLQLLSIPLAAALALLGLRQGIKPLEQLSDDLVARNQNDFTPLDVRRAPLELMPLVVGFNELLARVESENIRQQRFIDNAAHQLRTPLAGLLLTTELALRSHDDADRKRALEVIYQATRRSAHTIDQLLTLARAEHSGKESFEEVNLNDLILRVVEDRLPDAAAKTIDLGVDCRKAPATTTGNQLLLRELLANLLDNAIRYTPPGGTVTVGIEGRESRWLLFVEDNGKGIPASDQSRIWERFYRGTQQDTSDTTGGTGLGLAIVKEISDLHDAPVALVARAGQHGARFEVTLRST
jgi:two-component system sensor histidine kinase TctE